MSRRGITLSLTAPAPALSCLPKQRSNRAFAEWLDRERVAPRVLAGELGITVGYVYQLKSGSVTPGARLRIRILARTDGKVPFDSWE